MPDLIQFECPACASTLRIPIELSGQDGPCPICQNIIVAPDPYTGIGAYLAMAVHPSGTAYPTVHHPDPSQPVQQQPAQAVAVEVLAPSDFEKDASPEPFSSNQPFPDRLLPTEPVKEDLSSTSSKMLSHFDDPLPLDRPKPKRRSIAPVLAGVAVLLLAGVAGGAFLLRDKISPAPPEGPLVVSPKPSLPPAATIPPAPSVPADSTPPPTAPKPHEEPPQKAPEKVITAAETTLKAFLEAPDWAARSTYVLSPESARSKMEAYSKNNPDGPTAFSSFSVKHSQVDEKTGSTLFVFQVESPDAPGGIPVAILETSKGWLVDWESFVEFRDDQFRHFTEGPSDLQGDFHLIVTSPQGPPGVAQENENFAGFNLSPPLPDRQRTAFVKKSNPVYLELKEATANGRVFTPVLEIAKRNVDGKQSYLEILSIKATDWRPKVK